MMSERMPLARVERAPQNAHVRRRRIEPHLPRRERPRRRLLLIERYEDRHTAHGHGALLSHARASRVRSGLRTRPRQLGATAQPGSRNNGRATPFSFDLTGVRDMSETWHMLRKAWRATALWVGSEEESGEWLNS